MLTDIEASLNAVLCCIVSGILNNPTLHDPRELFERRDGGGQVFVKRADQILDVAFESRVDVMQHHVPSAGQLSIFPHG